MSAPYPKYSPPESCSSTCLQACGGLLHSAQTWHADAVLGKSVVPAKGSRNRQAAHLPRAKITRTFSGAFQLAILEYHRRISITPHDSTA
eukprot:541554-Pelagomonas_calceolata.AAC.1